MPGTHEINSGKGKTYRGLIRFERACASCGERFAIHVTGNVADGVAHNTGFGLRNCEKHRMKMVAAGSDGSTDEIDKLRMMVKCMKEELDPVYARNKELFAEVQVLKAKLATYDLQFGMQSLSEVPPMPRSVEPVMNGGDNAVGRQLAQAFAEKIKNKMPWEA